VGQIRMRPSAAAVSLVLGITLASLNVGPAGGAGRSVRPGSVVNVSVMPDNQNEVTIAVNPTNPQNVVTTSNLETGVGLFEGVSMDGGRTWTRKVIADGDSLGKACCDSQLAFDGFGNLFMAYLDAFDFTVIPIGISTDGGVSWTQLARIDAVLTGPARHLPTRNLSGPGIVFADQPSIAAGEGSVWVSFTANADIEATGARVTGLGSVGRFFTPEKARGAGTGDYGDIAIGPDGQVMVTYQNPSGGEGPARIYTDLDPDGLGPQGFDQAQLVQQTNVGGFDYIPAQRNRSVDAEAGLAWDRTGRSHQDRLYLVYTSESPDESDDMDINVRYSDNNGGTWSPSVRVNDDSGTNSQFLPRIALDQTTGNIAVGWYEARFDLGTGGAGDTDGHPNTDAVFFAAVSRDGGLSFSPNVRVARAASNSDKANAGIDYGDYTGLDFYGGAFYPAWADNSNSTGDNPDGTLDELDIYTAMVRVT
jgi:hypothetical protein